MIRIDAHQHFWDPARGDYGWLSPTDTTLYRQFGPSDLEPLLDAHDIAGTILVQAAPTEKEAEYLLSLADASPFIQGVVGWIDLDAVDVQDRIARFAKHPRAVGVRPMLQDIPDPEWILAPSRRAAISAISAHGLVFDALVRPNGLAAITELAHRHDRLTVVLDHGGKPKIGYGLDEWRTAIETLAALPNTACKLSGLLTEADGPVSAADLSPYVACIVEAFGSDRVLWGSDWPVLLLASDYAAWARITAQLLAKLDADAQAAILGGTARRLYRLDARS